jgi:hypothetical protein
VSESFGGTPNDCVRTHLHVLLADEALVSTQIDEGAGTGEMLEFELRGPGATTDRTEQAIRRALTRLRGE